jgi:hypothetical protein
MRTTIAGERLYVVRGLRIELDETSLPYDASNEFD